MNVFHKNYPKRFYFRNKPYFLTTITHKRHPYFLHSGKTAEMNEIFCELLVQEILLAKKIFRFELYGFVILPQHLHLQIKPLDIFENNFSKIMAFIKRNYSRNHNYILGLGEFDQIHPTRVKEKFKMHANLFEEMSQCVARAKNKFALKFHNQKFLSGKFCWLRGFFYQIIFDRISFDNHLDYILKNPVHHGLTNDWRSYPWSSANPRWRNHIDVLK